MMKKSILLSVLLISIGNARGQNPTFSWAKGFGGTTNDFGNCIAVDANGNVITGGHFQATMDADPGAGTFNLTASAAADGFISKLDASGNFVWAYQVGGTGNDFVVSVTTDAAGNVYATGENGNNDIFFCKLNASGTPAWSHTIGYALGVDRGRSISVDNTGNVYVTGEFAGTVDFDPGAGVSNITSFSGSTDVFIAKYDASGNFVWAKRIGGADTDVSFSLKLDAANNVFTTGYWSGTADFDPGAGTFNMTTSSTPNDAFISKLDASGNFVWAKQIAGPGHSYGHAITVDASGNIYSAGYFGGTSDFDPGIGTFNMSGMIGGDIYISKLDASGTFIWAKSIAATTGANNIVNSIAVDNSSNVYTTGNFSGTADFDPGVGVYNLTPIAFADGFISKLDASGNFEWAFLSGDDGRGLTLDASQNVYVTGAFANTVDFDPGAGVFNLSALGGAPADVFTLKLSDCTTLSAPSSISGSTTLCEGTTQTYSVTNDPSATSYTWTLPSGWSGTSTTNSINATSGSSGGNISVTANNACGSSSASSLAVTISAVPATPGAISGTTTICAGSGNTYSVTAVPGATSYTWTLPSGWSGTSGTNSITTTSGSSSGSITVTANNSCGSSAAATLPIIVNTPPATPGTISGNTAVCLGATNTYSVTNDPSATSYTWNLPSGWSGSSSTNSIAATSGSSSGNITVTANNSCGSSSAASLTIISVSTTPVNPGPISGSATICEGGSYTYSIIPAGDASTYNWTLPGDWTGSSTSSTINITAGATSGTVAITATNICGTSTAANFAVTVINGTPATPGAIAGNATICEGSSNNYSVGGVVGATSYTWTLPSGWSGTSGTNSITAASGSSGGNITVTANNSCGSSAASTLPIIVNGLPAVTYTQDPSFVCVYHGAIDLAIASPAGGTFSGTAVTGTTFNATTAGVGTFTITYTFTDANNCTNNSSENITVDGCLGTDEQNGITQLQIYPSPTAGTFTLICPGLNHSTGTITIYNSIGELVVSIQSNTATNQFDLSDLRSGVYLVQIHTGEEIITGKIIKH